MTLKEEVIEVLKLDFNLTIEDIVYIATKIKDNLQRDLTDNQFSACVHLAADIGIGHSRDKNKRGFIHSDVLRFINQGYNDLAREAFKKYIWSYDSKGELVILAEQLKRRQFEIKLFNK